MMETLNSINILTNKLFTKDNTYNIIILDNIVPIQQKDYLNLHILLLSLFISNFSFI